MPEKYGPVLYAISESNDKVALKAVAGTRLQDTEQEEKSALYGKAYSQQAFYTSTVALLPGVLSGPTAPISVTDNSPAVFTFDRTASHVRAKLYKADNNKTSQDSNLTKVDLHNKTITVNTSKLSIGPYLLEVTFTYLLGKDDAGTDQIVKSSTSATFALKK